MPTSKNQPRKPVKLRKQLSPKGSRVGDDLVEAFEQMAAHLRGEIELEDVSPRR